MIDIDFDIDSISDDIISSDSSGIFEQLANLKNQVAFDYVINCITDIEVSKFFITYTESLIKDKENEIKRAFEVIETLKARKASIEEQNRPLNKLKEIFSKCAESAKKLGSLIVTVAKASYRVSASVFKFDHKVFIAELLKSSKIVGKSLLDSTGEILLNTWDSMTKMNESIARALNDQGLNFVGEGLLSLGRFVNKVIENLCDDTVLMVLDIAVPVVAGIGAGVMSGGTAVAGGIVAGEKVMGGVRAGCFLGEIGSIFVDLQLDAFENSLDKKELKDIDKDIQSVQSIISNIENQKSSLGGDIRDEREKIENAKLKLVLTIASESFFEKLESEYPILSPEEALRVYFTTSGSKFFKKIVNSGVTTLKDIQDLISVIIACANDLFGGQKKCPALEARFSAYLNGIFGTSELNYCKFISQTQIKIMKRDFDDTFRNDEIIKSMSLADFLRTHGERLNQLTSENFKKKAYLYKNILSASERHHLFGLLNEAGLNADAIIYGILEEDFSGDVIEKRSIFWTIASFGITSYLAFYLYKRYNKVSNA